MEEHQIATILLKVVEVLDGLHSQEKVHTDVTIANITLSESGGVKLLDSCHSAGESILKVMTEAGQLTEDDQKVL